MTFIPTAKQQKALQMLSEKREDGEFRYKFFLLCGGSRSGKTAICCYLMALRAYASPKPSKHAILRFHFNDVKTSVGMDTLPKILKLMGVPYSLNKTDWFFSIPNQNGGESEIWLAGTDSEDRTDKILGKEYSTIYFNEASQISYQSYTTVLSRLAENSGLHNRILIDCNPTEKSHYLYKMFVLGKQPNSEQELLNRDYYGSIQMNPTENPHLPADYISNVLSTLPERQKQRFLYGEWQNKREGALFNSEQIERARVTSAPQSLPRIHIGIDPAVTSGENSDETGIIVVARDNVGDYYVLKDCSLKGTPAEWANAACQAFADLQADSIIYESNQGGEMVEHTIHSVNNSIPCHSVRATRGKALRAEPVAALYEQGKVHHVGYFPELEEQMSEWTPEDSKSPDRLDALVHAVTFLMGVPMRSGIQPNFSSWSNSSVGRPPVFSSGGFSGFGGGGMERPPRFF